MNNISHAATILPVSDMQKSLNFYLGVLGFTASYLHEDPPSYAVLKLGEISLHLSETDAEITPRPSIYFFVHEVDEIWNHIKATYDSSLGEPHSWDYGMRDFEVADPSGHRLIFGKHKDN
jgi:catechol 2,3-dioxygenase-like lactoylglutathione lyase family enzyme